MSKARKSIAFALATMMSLGLCVGAYADTVTVLDNGSAPEETSAQTGMAPAPAPEGAVGGSLRADIPAGEAQKEIPIASGSGLLGMDVRITKGGAYVESVTLENGKLVVKAKSPGALEGEQEYAVEVTLYDLETGKSSFVTVSGVIGAAQESSQPESSASSQPDQIAGIGLKDAVDSIVTAHLYKYGGDSEIAIPILVPEGAGAIRLKDKEILEGRDVIRKVSVSGRKLLVEAKFPYSMLDEPEPYEIEVTLEDSKGKATANFLIRGTVYWQATAVPVAPHEYREKKAVIVDFDGNDGETLYFENGSIRTDGLKSGVANLDISYADSGADCDGLDVYTVNFLASPKLDRAVTVCLDADEGNCVYQVSGNGKLTKLDAVYNKSAGELRFTTRRLGEYVVTLRELKPDSKPASDFSGGENTAPSKAETPKENTEKTPQNGNSSHTEKQNPRTGR
ncbi:MAG: hypothetical protein HFG20_11555 [Anaerotruncus sp.]|nr:hypothetical protein [Anaerotruncus sp.]